MEELNFDFTNYLNEFEQNVIIKGVLSGVLGRVQFVSMKNCKLSRTEFAKIMGLEFPCIRPIAIDYYGLIKKSSACSCITEEDGKIIKMLEMPIVHFASIRIGHINLLYRSLLSDFADFKEEVIRLRGFPQK